MPNYVLDKNVHRTTKVNVPWTLGTDAIQVTFKTTGTPKPPQIEIVIGSNYYYVDCPGIKIPANMDCPISEITDPNNQFDLTLDNTIYVFTVGHELTDPMDGNFSLYVINGKDMSDGTESDYIVFTANAVSATAAAKATPAVATTMMAVDGPGMKVPPTVGADLKFAAADLDTVQ